ncbi:MAG: nucleoside monophosphate kinase [Candidatus Saccharibacteria bacterium]
MKQLGFDLILLGAPAAGKNTQADLLMKCYVLNPVETGKYLRALMEKNDAVARKLRETTGVGNPAPVKIIKDYISERVAHARPAENLLFIGNPRLKPEAQYLKKLLHARRRDFLAFYITLPEKEILRRVRSRNENRIDDDLRFAKNRIRYHNTQVKKTIGYFTKLHKIRLIRGNQPIRKVYADINRAINDYQRSTRN